MTQEILVNITACEVRIAILENAVLQQIHIERNTEQGIIGNIYKGRVSRLLPGIQAAFVDIGLERPGFLHISDLDAHNQLSQNATDITHCVRVGQKLLVQVYKDELGSKGARLTTRFTIPARYLVLTPALPEIAVSQKITDIAEQQRLLNMLTPTGENGYIFRTVAEGVEQSAVDADKAFLNTLWEEIILRSKQAQVGQNIYTDIPLVLRILRDSVGYAVQRIRIDNYDILLKMQNFIASYMPDFSASLEYYEDKKPIFDLHKVEDQLQKALERKISLKGGGHIVFDQTEAMTTIDVNTGSKGRVSHCEQTVLTTNLAAVDVIAHQLQLRNVGGIIIIDFIDMTDPQHKTQLLQALTLALAKDSAKTQISELSSLGLVQLTRKRTRESLEHILCVPCYLCHKRGSIKSLETMYFEIFRELQRRALLYVESGFLVIAAPDVVEGLLTTEQAILAGLAAQLGKSIKLQAEPSYGRERFDILPDGEKYPLKGR